MRLPLYSSSAQPLLHTKSEFPLQRQRFVSATNYIYRGEDGATGRDRRADRWPHYIQTPCKDISFAWCGWRIASSNGALCTDIGNDIEILGASAECNGIVVQLTFNGQNTITIPNGGNDIRCDRLTPAMFGLTQFDRGTIIWTKSIMAVPASGKAPWTERNVSQISGSRAWLYYDAQTSVTNLLSAGALTYTGSVPASRGNGFEPWCLGTPINSAQKVMIARGDSITQAASDSGDNIDPHAYRAWFQRACFTLQYPCANFAIHGSSSIAGTGDPRLSYWYKHATDGVIKYGTNNIGANETPASIQMIRDNVLAIATNMRAQGIDRVGIAKLLPRTEGGSVDNNDWRTEADQDIKAGWGLGEASTQFNDSLSSLGFDYVIPFDSVRGVDPLKWKVDGTPDYMTPDGTHPSTTGHTLMAAEATPFLSGAQS